MSPEVRCANSAGSSIVGHGRPSPRDEFRSHWLWLPVQMFRTDHTPDQPPVTIEVRTGDQPMLIETADGGVRCAPAAPTTPTRRSPALRRSDGGRLCRECSEYLLTGWLSNPRV